MTRRATSHRTGGRAKGSSPKKASTRKAKPPSSSSSSYTVFISHSSREKWIAGRIAREIEALGAKTWLDLKELHGGDEIRRSIRRGISASQEVVVLLSANSITSQWVIFEAGIASGQRKRITPILNNIAPDETLAPLQGIKALDLNDFDSFLVELAGRVKKRIARARKAAA